MLVLEHMSTLGVRTERLRQENLAAVAIAWRHQMFCALLSLLLDGMMVNAQTTAAPTTAAAATTAGAATTTGAAALPSCTNAGMTDEVRAAYLDKHNNYRSSLAKGNAYNGDKGYAGKATNMQKMNYDCNAEASAIRHANSCSGKLSDPNSRPGLKENIIKINKIYLTQKEAAEKGTRRLVGKRKDFISEVCKCACKKSAMAQAQTMSRVRESLESLGPHTVE
ncbi:SCP-like protein [Ancylostoma duodenale]|uniref:SCP-like protein n=1 Tax=Ancylostoma duodenale TaxID=51022 RepID=A0A0C2DFA9_9BILA|nr:SCP-like protein [Ancylostoma duodenale]